jgi:hypothetical protein
VVDEKKKGAGGRPPKYRAEFAEQARKLCLLGATDDVLADFFEVSSSCVSKWKVAHPEFLQSLKDGKQLADATVAERLFNRACGFTTKETKIATFEGQITDTREVDKHYPPDSTAAIFWLKNRQSATWRDRVEQKVVLTDDFDSLLGQANDED